jgi:hypothetical protein
MHQVVAAHADALSLLAVVASAWLALELLFYVMVRHVLLPRLQPLTKPPAYPVQARKLMTKVQARLFGGSKPACGLFCFLLGGSAAGLFGFLFAAFGERIGVKRVKTAVI